MLQKYCAWTTCVVGYPFSNTLFCAIKAQIFGVIKNIVSISYLLVSDFYDITNYTFLNRMLLFHWPRILHPVFLEMSHAGICKL